MYNAIMLLSINRLTARAVVSTVLITPLRGERVGRVCLLQLSFYSCWLLLLLRLLYTVCQARGLKGTGGPGFWRCCWPCSQLVRRVVVVVVRSDSKCHGRTTHAHTNACLFWYSSLVIHIVSLDVSRADFKCIYDAGIYIYPSMGFFYCRARD